jgi:hypothetical protein
MDPIPSATPDTPPTTPPPVDPSIAGAPGASDSADSWAAAAQPAKPQPGVQPSDATSDATIPSQPLSGEVPTKVLTQKLSPLAHAVDATLNALTGGGQKPQIATDANGNEYVKHVSMTHGEQWFRIGTEALHGAAVGLAAGKGAGNMGKAAAAGWGAGAEDQQKVDQNEKDMTAEARQQNADNANYQMLQMQKTEQNWKFTRMKLEAKQHDVDFSNAQIDRLTKPIKDGGPGGVIIGRAAHPADLAEILHTNPTLMADMIKKHQIEIQAAYDSNGDPAGIVAIKMPDEGYRATMLPPGQLFHTYDPIKDQYVEHHTQDPVMAGQIDDWESVANAASIKAKNDKAEQELKAQQAAQDKANAAKANADATEAPSVIAKNRAEANKANAEADSARATATQDTTQAGQTQDDIHEGLASGRYIMGKDVPLRTSKGQPSAAEQTAGANAYSLQHFGLPYSPEIVREEAKMAEQPKTQAYLTALDNLMGTPGKPGQLAQVVDLAQKAGLGPHAPLNAVAQGVKRFYGVTAAKNFEEILSDTQTSLGTLIGNSLLGSSDSDQKMRTARDQFGSNATLDNLKGAVDTASRILERSKSDLTRNNRFLQQRYGDAYSHTQVPQQQAPPPPPGMVTVQIPGKDPGHIPASALAKFQHDNPTAKVLQQ